MLVRAQGDGAIAIGQLSHAWLSGQLARAWGNERVLEPHPREPVALGAEQHDVGWARFDLEPRLNPETGLPYNFLETSVAEHLAIWHGAPEHLLSQSVIAALVVSLHGRALSELRAQRAAPEDALALRAHIEEERRRQERLAELIGVSEGWLEQTQRQMWAWDGISLALCAGWSPFTARAVPARAGPVDLRLRRERECTWVLSPWPFAVERVQLSCEARELGARFSDPRALHNAWRQARVLTLSFTLLAEHA